VNALDHKDCYGMMLAMIKQAVVTGETPSIESGRRGTVERGGESVCKDELLKVGSSPEKLSKSAAFTFKQEPEKE